MLSEKRLFVDVKFLLLRVLGGMKLGVLNMMLFLWMSVVIRLVMLKLMILICLLLVSSMLLGLMF